MCTDGHVGIVLHPALWVVDASEVLVEEIIEVLVDFIGLTEKNCVALNSRMPDGSNHVDLTRRRRIIHSACTLVASLSNLLGFCVTWKFTAYVNVCLVALEHSKRKEKPDDGFVSTRVDQKLVTYLVFHGQVSGVVLKTGFDGVQNGMLFHLLSSRSSLTKWAQEISHNTKNGGHP